MVAAVLGRPGRVDLERHVHRRRSHWRCHRNTVSGRTMSTALRHSRQTRARRIQKSRSLVRSRERFAVRVKAATCWRRARFSKATARCPRQINPIVRRSRTSAVSMSDPAAHAAMKSTRWPADQVLAKQCVQPRLACSVGDSPTGGKVRNLRSLGRIRGGNETDEADRQSHPRDGERVTGPQRK